MSIYETFVYGKRKGFVYLRYVAMVFFFLSQLATYFVILNALQQAGNALNAMEAGDVAGAVAAFSALHIPGAFGVLIDIMRNLGALVVPLYFVATVSFVLNLNRAEIGRFTRRTAILSILLFFAELVVYSILIGFVTLLVIQLFSFIEEAMGGYAEIIDLVNKLIAAVNSEGQLLPADSVAGLLEIAEDFLTDQIIIVLLKNMPSFNLFLDQLLCLLMCIIFCTRPKWANTRTKLALFRSLGAIPIAYILAIFIVNGLTRSGVIMPGVLVLCLFPARHLPPFLFIGCILLCNRFYPVRTLRVEKGLHTLALRKKTYSTRSFESVRSAKRRALETAVFLSGCLLLLCALDYLLGTFSFAGKWGLGKFYYAALCIPFLFLFDDRKPTSRRQYSVFSAIYLLVIVVIVLIYLFF